jgi:hypothetical protein
VGTAQERRNAGHRDWNIATSSILSSLYKKALPHTELEVVNAGSVEEIGNE